MRRRHGRVNRWVLVVLAGISVLCLLAATGSIRTVRGRLYEAKLAGVRLAERAFAQVRVFRESLGVPADSVNDPNLTGLVGLQYSQTTYGRSDLSDALTTTNPNFSAALVELFWRAGVRSGDTIAVSWDGTYPALNIQVLAAAQAIGVVPVVATAQSAGMWGANYPGMSWLDIEACLRRNGVWIYQSRFATLGGETDDGRGLSPLGRQSLAAAAESSGVRVVVPASLEQGVSLRLAEFGHAKVLVSVGRAVADIGEPGAKVPSRVLGVGVRRNRYEGLIGEALRRRIRVVRIGNPSQVAADYHLPVAPVPIPEPGKGRLFYEKRYSAAMAAAYALLLLVLLWIVVRYNVEWYVGVREEGADTEAV